MNKNKLIFYFISLLLLTSCANYNYSGWQSNGSVLNTSQSNVLVQVNGNMSILENVGIGTTSPNQKFVVVGNANITGNLNVSGCITYNGGILGTCIP